jgi:hypothetical protein
MTEYRPITESVITSPTSRTDSLWPFNSSSVSYNYVQCHFYQSLLGGLLPKDAEKTPKGSLNRYATSNLSNQALKQMLSSPTFVGRLTLKKMENLLGNSCSLQARSSIPGECFSHSAFKQCSSWPGSVSLTTPSQRIVTNQHGRCDCLLLDCHLQDIRPHERSSSALDGWLHYTCLLGWYPYRSSAHR